MNGTKPVDRRRKIPCRICRDRGDRMKRKTLATLLIMTAICLSTAGAALGIDEDASSIHPAIGIQGWFSSAFAKWQISFPYVTRSDNRAGNLTVPAGREKMESELDFDNIDSPIWIVTGGAAIGPDFSFEVLLGTGSIGNGHGTDTDRFLADSGGGLEFSQSKNDVDGNVKLGELNFYFNNHRFSGKHDGPWGAVLGYTHYEDQLHMTNAVQTVSETFDGTVFPPIGPFPPGLVLNSDFDFSWDAVKSGCPVSTFSDGAAFFYRNPVRLSLRKIQGRRFLGTCERGAVGTISVHSRPISHRPLQPATATTCRSGWHMLFWKIWNCPRDTGFFTFARRTGPIRHFLRTAPLPFRTWTGPP